jgi:glycosyltransferase involved in cell wall biosynthesis
MAVERAAGSGPSVLMTADTVGGVWTYAVELSRALIGRGWRVHLATMGAPVAAHQRAQVEHVDGLVLHEGGHKLEWMQDPWADVDRAGDWLLALERTLRPDLVHLNQFAFGALPFAAPTLLVAHSCVLSWWRAVHGEAAPPAWAAYRERVARGLRGARLVAAPTQAMLDTLSANYRFDTPTLVLPNGRNPGLFAPGDKRDIVFAAGRFWDEAKNLGALEAAAPGLPWPVRVAGSCAAPGGGTRQPRHVQALGELGAHDIAAEMARAAIYALPARYEPFGLSVLEAALSGCALVLGDIASLRETWGEAALYVDPRDPAALRGTLAALIADAPRRERMAAAAQARAQHFTSQRMADAVLASYRALLAGRSTVFREELTCA